MTTLVPEEFAPLERQSTAELIAERLRIAIMRGVLAPGAQLGEASLAAQFAVSRGPLREAMQRLVSEGLLCSERNRGIFVIELTDADVHNVYRSRTAIERAALECIMSGDTVTAYRRLLVPVAVMTEAAARGDMIAVTDADQNFHEVLVDCSGSPGCAAPCARCCWRPGCCWVSYREPTRTSASRSVSTRCSARRSAPGTHPPPID